MLNVGGSNEYLTQRSKEEILQQGLGIPLKYAMEMEFSWSELLNLALAYGSTAFLKHLVKRRTEFSGDLADSEDIDIAKSVLRNLS